MSNAPVAWFVVAAPLLLWGAWLSRRRASLADTPRSRCAAVFVGFNEITGAVETVQPTRSWFTDTLAAWWHTTLEEEREYTRTETFTDSQGHTQTRTVVEHRFVQVESFSSDPFIRLFDETGRVLVDLTRATMSVPASYSEITRSPKWSEPRGHLFVATTGRYRQQEWTLVDGQTLFVVGGARIDDSGSDVVVDGTGPGEFLVTTRSEASITTGRRVGTWCLLVLGVAAVAVGCGSVDRSPWSYVAGGLGAALVVVGWGTFALYNRLVRLQQAQERAWSLIEVQLARRATLIPQMVDVVKGYAAHEAGLQTALAADRATSPAALLALREAYPQLKADAVYQRLFDELTGTENRIAGARDYFNEAVTILRDRTRTFPGVLLAGPAKAGRFGARELIVAGQEERARPQVRLS